MQIRTKQIRTKQGPTVVHEFWKRAKISQLFLSFPIYLALNKFLKYT